MKKILILLFAAGCFFMPSAIPMAFANEPITTSSLWEAFQAEPDAFREKYSGKQITISAIVDDTYISRYLTPVVQVVDKIGDEARVSCVLPRSDVGKFSNFKKGEKVKITGNFYSARESRIVIKQCQAAE